MRYADNFIVASDRRETLEQTVLPAIEQFLAKRGLRLSAEKTSITHIAEGFDFLGKHVRKFAHGKLITTPSKKNVKAICAKIRETARKCRGLSAATLIGRLNPIVRGWAQAHRTVQAARTFRVVDQYLFETVWRWCRRSHRKQSRRWIFRRYFRRKDGQSGWGRFHATEQDRSGQRRLVELLVPGDIPLVRYIKVRGKSNPHAARDGAYFQMRRKANTYRELSPPRRRT